MSAYIFSHCALEAYVNFRIDSFRPTEADYIAVEQLIKKIHDHSDLVKVKVDLIKDSSLEEKLFHMLPYFLSKKKINVSEINIFASDFTFLNAVRNSLIHLKRSKIRSGQQEDGKFKTNNFWNSLIPKFGKDRITLRFYPAQFATKVIEYIEKACGQK